ncbi:hypothetical protein ALC62_04609, partial [Cyphomyrmex costatus]
RIARQFPRTFGLWLSGKTTRTRGKIGSVERNFTTLRGRSVLEELDNELDPEEANPYSTDEHGIRERLTLFTATQRNALQREERSPPEIIFEECRVRERIYEKPPSHEQMINKYV